MLSSLQRGLTQATQPHLDWLLPPSPPGSPALLWHMTCTASQSSICYLLLFKGKDRVIYKWPICVPFYGWIIFHCVYVPHLVYPFLCPWTFSLFPCVVYLDLNTQYHISKIYLCCCVFNSKDSVASVFLGVLPHFIYSWTIIMNL